MGFDDMANIENTYKTTSQINNGVYVVKDGDSQWGGVLNHNFEILSQLNKRAKLIITYGDVDENTMLSTHWTYSIDGPDVLVKLPRQSIPQIPNTSGILTLKSGDNVIGTYNPASNSTISIPKSIDEKTLIITYDDEVIGQFKTTEDATINIPKEVQHAISFTYDGDTIGTFDNTDDVTIDIPKEPHYAITFTYDGDPIGTFDNTDDLTIDIPKSSSATNADIYIKKSEDYDDLNGDPVFTTVQTFNTGVSSDLNTYNLILNIGNNQFKYNPFADTTVVNISQSSGGSGGNVNLDDISERISFEIPKSSRPALQSDPPAIIETKDFYVKTANNNPRTGALTVELPVYFTDFEDADGNDLGHWHLYSSCKVTLDIGRYYAKLSDIKTYSNLSEFTNDVGFVTKDDASGDFVAQSEKNVPNGVAILNDEGHLVLPSGIEIW